MKNSNIFSKLYSLEDLNYYKSLTPITFYKQKHFSFDCSICKTEQHKMLKSISYPFICTSCMCKISNGNIDKINLCKETKYNKYGDENYNNKQQQRQTMILKHGGVGNASNNVFTKYKSTMFKKYNGIGLNSPDVFLKYKSTMIKKYGGIGFNSSEISEKIRNYLFSNYGVFYPCQSPILRLKMFKKFKGPNNLFYDSSWEYLFECYLIENSIPYIYQSPLTYKWYDINHKEHTYIPDFYVEGHLVEIKGEQFFDSNNNYINPYDRSETAQINAKLKYQCMLNNHVIILRKYDLENLGIKLTRIY